ncbi:MAG TPA: alpha/beta fold hydrolase [Burkholderiaceae bacterium]|nr:alpha/beta fold hydrolase [Burkholderiaceae bacterium]
MLARLQQITTLGGLTLAVLWAVYFAARGQAGWAAGGALIIVFGYAAVLGLEFILLRRVGRSDPAPAPSARELALAWIGEVLTAPRVFCWHQPFRSTMQADHLPADAAGRLGIVFVHGFVCNRGLWNPWMARLRAAGVPFVAINLEPVFGAIDRYVPLVDAAVRRVHEATGRPPLIVAHSMGGLAARAWLHEHAADERIDHVITIGTPHGGTWLARFALTANARQMRLGGPWVSALAQREPASRYARFTCFYSHCDNIAFPPSTGTLPGADNRHVRGIAHVHLNFHPEVFDEVWRRVRA